MTTPRILLQTSDPDEVALPKLDLAGALMARIADLEHQLEVAKHELQYLRGWRDAMTGSKPDAGA